MAMERGNQMNVGSIKLDVDNPVRPNKKFKSSVKETEEKSGQPPHDHAVRTDVRIYQDGTECPIIVPARPPQLHYMGKTGICYDVRMRYHSRLNTNPLSYLDPHPEDPRRTYRIYKTIAEAGLLVDETLEGSDELGDYFQKLPSREATAEEILLVHSQEHLNFMKSTMTMDREQLCKETDNGDSIYLNNDSYLAAKLSCGNAIEACRAVVEGRVKNALAVIRPPGHHAEPDSAGGFCMFSNVAVAAKVVLRDYPALVKKIVILDWDVHHGNGTQKAFFDSSSVLYISLHRYDGGKFYPGTKYGAATVVGEGAGTGFNVNIPWENPAMGDAEYMAAFFRIILPIVTEFCPDLVIISSGFDAAKGDFLGGYEVTSNCYAHMAHMMKTFACGKLVVCLEGGYNLDSISICARAVAKVLLGDPPAGPPSTVLPAAGAREVISNVVQIQSKYWKILGPQVPEASNEVLHEAIPLSNVLRSGEMFHLSEKYNLVSYPVPNDGSLIGLSRHQLLASISIHEVDKIFVILHDDPLIWAYTDPVTGMIDPSSSVVASCTKPYIEWATRNNYGIMDIQLTNESSREGQSGYTEAQEFVTHIWDNLIKYFKASNIVFIGFGAGYLGLLHLAGHRDIRDRCNTLIAFIKDGLLKPIIPAISDNVVDWFYQSSLIFTTISAKSKDEKHHERHQKKSGRVIKTLCNNIFDMVAERFEESIEFITDE